MKTEVQHFTEDSELQHFTIEKLSKNDNAYGVVWGNVVREYLKTAYLAENTQADVVLDGIAYKVLKREAVTVFYDADGNTLFDVENKRLEKEYGYVMQEENTFDEFNEKNVDLEKEKTDVIKQIAKKKLEKEMESNKDKTFAEPVIGYLLKRCEEDLGLSQDVAQKHKTWKKCFGYICSQARKQANGNCAVVRDDVVYEWAEDYYHKDDKAEEEKKVKEAAKRNESQSERTEELKIKQNKTEESKPDRNSKDIDGQIDMFSMFGI